jgi:hypothetical protein
MAEQLGFDDLRLRALDTVGCARGGMGDPAGLAEVESVIELASQASAIAELIRGWNNYTALLALHGNMRQVRAAETETVRLATHYGHHGFVRFIEGAAAIGNRYQTGEWDDAFARAEKVIAEIDQGVPIYGAGTAHGYRGLIKLARDDEAGAEADAVRTIELSGTVGDPQAVNPTLAVAAFIFASVGNKQRSGEMVTQALDNLRPLGHFSFGVIDSPWLMLAALELSREDEVVEVFAPQPWKALWVRALLAIAARDFQKAADLCAELGSRSLEAFLRLQSGQPDDVRAALEYYKAVGATRYIREADALQAASA